tara:strand:- start:358 stop:609 length:252 start_codon:yes stop_codon:yes gene_type:complete
MAIALGDLNNDGNIDIVVGNNGQNNQFYLNNVKNLTQHEYGLRSTITYGISLGDLNGDGYIDIVEANSDSENLIFFNKRITEK